MSLTLQKFKSRDFRYEAIIKLILLFLFLMFSGNFLNMLPEGMSKTLPKIFKNSTISLTVILLLANWAIDKAIIQKIKIGLCHKFFIISFIYWLLHIAGWYFSSNRSEAGYIIEKKLSLILFPLIFATIHISEHSKLNIYKWFVFLLIFFSTTCLFYGYYNYLRTGDIKMMSLEYSLYIDIHRVVMSMYLTLGAYFAFELHHKGRLHLGWLLTYMAIASIHLLLMASRLYMVVYMVFIYFLFYRYIPSKRLFYGISAGAITVAILAGIFMFKTNKLFRSQIETLFMERQNSVATTNGVSERGYQWDASTTLIKRNPIFGIGTGDVVDALQQEYKAMNWDIGYSHRYHAHNQYLQTFIALGIVGFISLLLMVFYPWIFYKETGIEAKICSILFGISMLTDNHTELQQSIIFMFLWLGMFINLKPTQQINTTK